MALSKQALKKVLVVEDDPGLQSQMRWCFDGYDVIVAGDREEAIKQLIAHEPDVITLDLGLPPDAENASEGLAALTEIIEQDASAKIIVVTGNDDKENAMRAVGLGAYDFYQKPVEPDTLKFVVDRAAYLRELELQNKMLVKRNIEATFGGIVFASDAMQKICKTIEKVAPTDITTLLLGDSGTGKELLARALHDKSTRASKRFVAINCAAIPENLLESELFGYEKGAFTGAVKQTLGKIECANGGTLFLDEIGDLGQPLQAKLLRFLQERVIERIGGRDEIPVDVRVVCATHQNLDAYVTDGKFREDLFYRISEMTIKIPPLCERSDDAILLARTFLERFNRENNKNIKGFSREALAEIESYQWPGNVREIENRVKRAVIMADEQHITAEDLDLESLTSEADIQLNMRDVKHAAEQQALRRAMGMCGNNISQMAELLGVSRPTLYTLLEKHGLK